MPSTRLSDCASLLQSAYSVLLEDFREENPGHDLLITCTYRSPIEQAALYAQGRTTPGPIVTQLSGEVGQRSKHNDLPARAIDVAVLVAGKVSWDVAQYAPLGPLALRHGLVWGGSWPHFKDNPHLELPDSA